MEQKEQDGQDGCSVEQVWGESEAKEEVPTPVAQGGMMEGSGISWTSRAGRRQQLGRPDLQDVSRRSPTCSPTYSLPSPWSTLGGGGHGDAQLAQLVWLVLASWSRRALRRGEDEAGRAHRKSRGRGSAFVLEPTPVDPILIPNTPSQKAHWALSGPASGTRSLISPSLTSSSLTQESGFPYTASPPGLISQDSQLSVYVGPFSPRFFF